MTYPDDLIPLPVEVINLRDLKASESKCHYDLTLRTITLTAANPVRDVFAGDLSRRLVICQAFTNDVVLCQSQSQAQDPANAATANPGFPEGYLLAAANTTPTYLPVTDLAWATAGTFPAKLTLCLINEVHG